MSDAALLQISRDLNRKYVDALRKIAEIKAAVEVCDDNETAADKYSRALGVARLIARQALPITDIK